MSNLMLFAIPVFFLTIFIDWLALYLKGKKNYYRFADTITNLNLGAGSQAVGLLGKFILLGVYDFSYEHFSFIQLGNSWWVILSCLILFDFIYYWAHRWGHEINFFWGAHVVHHQSEEYNLSVALRQSWFHSFVAFPLFLPLAVLGFNTMVLAGVAGFVTLYQYWIHTKAINKFPTWFEYVFNTPSHHRVHHGVNKKYLDKNHGAFLIIWDRLFGTFQLEEEEPQYGITTRFPSMNPIWSNFHYYAEMMQKASAMKYWKDKLKMIVAKPGWLPEELGGFQNPSEPEPDIDVLEPRISLSSKIYVGVQFFLIIWGLLSFMMFFENLSWFYRLTFFSIFIMSLLICGAIIENKKWVVFAEQVRLLMATISISVLYYQQFQHWVWLQLPLAIILFIACNIWVVNYKSKEAFSSPTV